MTFAAGETEKTVTVMLIDDEVEDSGETFRLILSDPTGAELADAEAVGTILNTEVGGRLPGRHHHNGNRLGRKFPDGRARVEW